MTTSTSQQLPSVPLWPWVGRYGPAAEYLVDAAQRSVLFWDVCDSAAINIASIWPRLLRTYSIIQAELVVDGRTLDRPVNYVLARIVPPPASRSTDNGGRSSLLIRAPGTAPASAASRPTANRRRTRAGHPCYFVGFLPDPMPGQTIEDIARAEAVFLEKVIALHPEADGKPCVIGNCQAGWAVMMLAAAA